MLPLLDKIDNFEVVRDKIAQILADESARQVILAVPPHDPEDYRLNVYVERACPWETWLSPERVGIDTAPIINVFYESCTFDASASSTFTSQTAQGVFNIDCYGLGLSYETSAGHMPGDEAAARESHRAVRLVRNILMAAENNYLGLRGIVGRRWPLSHTSFLPQKDVSPMQRVVVTRFVLGVNFLETAPQYEGVDAELLHIDLKRAEDGRVLAALEYAIT